MLSNSFFLHTMPIQPLSQTERVRNMFDSIATRYDLLNKLMTFGVDQLWRRDAVLAVKELHPTTLLDVAVGTADLSLDMAEKVSSLTKIVGVDISKEMLQKGEEKVCKAALPVPIVLMEANCEALPFTDNAFDVLTCAFGVRNFERLDASLAEMYRVTAKGGHIVILELSVPRIPILRAGYALWTRTFVPFVGSLVAHNREAYTYLPRSVRAMPQYEAFAERLTKAGYQHVSFTPLSGGIATLYKAVK